MAALFHRAIADEPRYALRVTANVLQTTVDALCDKLATIRLN